MTRTSYLLLLLTALAIAAMAGCGGSEDEGPGPGAYGLQRGDEKSASRELEEEEIEKIEARPEKGEWGVVFGAGTEDGMLIVDLSGHVLYTFDLDKGGKSACYGACAEAWPPALTEDKAKPGGSAQPDEVGTTKRSDGTIQLTYAGQPLYRYSRDKSGEASGNGVEAFGGEWRAIRPSGEKMN